MVKTLTKLKLFDNIISWSS